MNSKKNEGGFGEGFSRGDMGTQKPQEEKKSAGGPPTFTKGGPQRTGGDGPPSFNRSGPPKFSK